MRAIISRRLDMADVLLRKKYCVHYDVNLVVGKQSSALSCLIEGDLSLSRTSPWENVNLFEDAPSPPPPPEQHTKVYRY